MVKKIKVTLSPEMEALLEARYGLQPNTVGAYVRAHEEELVKSGEIRRPDGRTILVNLQTAKRIWG